MGKHAKPFSLDSPFAHAQEANMPKQMYAALADLLSHIFRGGCVPKP